MKNQIIPGVYEHYKGNKYKVIAIAKHSENMEDLVVYQALYGEQEFWVRPLLMFSENVNINGVEQPRFKYISE